MTVGTLPNGYTKSSPLPRVNPKARVNPRPEYRAQLALQAHAATQCQLLQCTFTPASKTGTKIIQNDQTL